MCTVKSNNCFVRPITYLEVTCMTTMLPRPARGEQKHRGSYIILLKLNIKMVNEK